MANTGAPWNLPYPLGTDLVIDGAQAIQDLAEAVDAGLDATKDGGNITSGTVAAARVGNLDASKVTSGAFVRDRLPFRIQAGNVNSGLMSADTIVDVAVTFAAGRFTSTPNVVVGMDNGTALVSGIKDLQAVLLTGSATSSGFTVRWANGFAGANGCSAFWIALQE